jgi:hypothetical protein
VSILHVKTRHNHRKHENHRREADGIPQSVRIASKMRPLLRIFERTARKRAVARRVLALPKSAPMQPTQKINAPTAQKRLPLPFIKTITKFDFGKDQVLPRRGLSAWLRFLWRMRNYLSLPPVLG